MIKVLFVCHGNICRSPMAQSYMQYLADTSKFKEEFFIDSAATHTDEIGSFVHHGTRRVLEEHQIPLVKHYARQITKKDYAQFDYIIGMDFANMRNLKRILGDDREKKVKLLLLFAGEEREVADPWYTGDFQTTFSDVKKGCDALFDMILKLRSKEK